MNFLITAFCALFFVGCATTFKPMRQDAYDYDSPRDTSGIEVKYMFNPLGASGNSFYAQKARGEGVDVVAVKLTNNTDREINVKRDLDFYVGNTEASPQDPAASLATVRQRTGGYAWWLLLMLVNGFKYEVTCDSYNGCREDTQFIPIGIILGPVIAFGNMGVAASANGAVIKEIDSKDASRQVLKPGQSYEGYLVFENIGKAAITARLKP